MFLPPRPPRLGREAPRDGVPNPIGIRLGKGADGLLRKRERVGRDPCYDDHTALVRDLQDRGERQEVTLPSRQREGRRDIGSDLFDPPESHGARADPIRQRRRLRRAQQSRVSYQGGATYRDHTAGSVEAGLVTAFILETARDGVADLEDALSQLFDLPTLAGPQGRLDHGNIHSVRAGRHPAAGTSGRPSDQRPRLGCSVIRRLPLAWKTIQDSTREPPPSCST